MFTLPTFSPKIVGVAAGCVWPAAIKTEPGTITLVASALVSVTVTPLGPAGESSFTTKGTVLPSETTVTAGTVIPLPPLTVTVAVVAGMVAVEALITAVPGATPVTGTVTVVAPAAKKAVALTVATDELADDTFTVRLVGVALLSVKVRF